MEASSMEVLSEGEWSSLSGMYTTADEANFMAQFLGANNPPLNPDLHSGSASGLRGCLDWHGSTDETSFYSSSSSSANFFSQIPNGPAHHHHHHESDHYLNLISNPNLSTLPNGRVFLTQSDIGDKYLNHDDEMMPEHMMSNNVQLKEEGESTKENVNNSFESSKKRSRSTGNIEKLKRNVKLKKTQSFELSRQMMEEDGSNSRSHKSNTCCSDQDESSLSLEPATLNLSGRTRASRGAATDPQSLYARKRRERINERLKVLQRLIPNGTKVDISTMLEEAVHYVRFLQLQIKLLSSDDHWMFAPIAYNGIDLGLDMRIDTPMR